jgi:hypothetical protein
VSASLRTSDKISKLRVIIFSPNELYFWYSSRRLFRAALCKHNIIKNDIEFSTGQNCFDLLQNIGGFVNIFTELIRLFVEGVTLDHPVSLQLPPLKRGIMFDLFQYWHRFFRYAQDDRQFKVKTYLDKKPILEPYY